VTIFALNRRFYNLSGLSLAWNRVNWSPKNPFGECRFNKVSSHLSHFKSCWQARHGTTWVLSYTVGVSRQPIVKDGKFHCIQGKVHARSEIDSVEFEVTWLNCNKEGKVRGSLKDLNFAIWEPFWVRNFVKSCLNLGSKFLEELVLEGWQMA